jgi:hypothetical protein
LAKVDTKATWYFPDLARAVRIAFNTGNGVDCQLQKFILAQLIQQRKWWAKEENGAKEVLTAIEDTPGLSRKLLVAMTAVVV